MFSRILHLFVFLQTKTFAAGNTAGRRGISVGHQERFDLPGPDGGRGGVGGVAFGTWMVLEVVS